jgi:hypothetical protein
MLASRSVSEDVLLHSTYTAHYAPLYFLHTLCTIQCTLHHAPYTVHHTPYSVRYATPYPILPPPDLSDPFSPFTTELWDKTAKSNTAVYDSLDGNTSVYRCTTTQQFKSALAAHNNPSYLDPVVKHSVAEIKGFLINWPQTLLENEDLSPSLATRTLVPNELWV